MKPWSGAKLQHVLGLPNIDVYNTARHTWHNCTNVSPTGSLHKYHFVPLVMVNPRTFFDFSVDDQPVGRYVNTVHLFCDKI
jgi:hypothetical protein